MRCSCSGHWGQLLFFWLFMLFYATVKLSVLWQTWNQRIWGLKKSPRRSWWGEVPGQVASGQCCQPISPCARKAEWDESPSIQTLPRVTFKRSYQSSVLLVLGKQTYCDCRSSELSLLYRRTERSAGFLQISEYTVTHSHPYSKMAIASVTTI